MILKHRFQVLKVLPIEHTSAIDKLLDYVPDLFEKVNEIMNDKWIGIAPFAKHKGKIYPLERMELVVKELSSKNGIKLFFFGNGPEEEGTIESWCNKYPNTVSFVGKSNFNGELRLISHLDVMVCMDSANMHMASLVGTPAAQAVR